MNIKILGYVELAIVGCIFIWCVILCLKNLKYILGKNEDNKEKIIRQPKWYFYGAAFVICVISFGFAYCIYDIRNYDVDKYFETIILAQTFFLPIGGGVYILLLYLNWEIRLYEDHFTHKNSLGVTRTYKYDEVRQKMFQSGCRYYKKGHYIFPISFLQPNSFALSEAIQEYWAKRLYLLPMENEIIDIEKLREEESKWYEGASFNDKNLYQNLMINISAGKTGIFLVDYIVNLDNKAAFPYIEDALLFWEDKKIQAISTYIIGNKDNKKAYDSILQAYLSLSQSEKERYAELYDKALCLTIAKEKVAHNLNWLLEWHNIINLPKTMKKIGEWDIPEVIDFWQSILDQQNTYESDYYDFEDAKEIVSDILENGTQIN